MGARRWIAIKIELAVAFADAGSTDQLRAAVREIGSDAEWTGVTPATGATVPPYAFTSGWPTEQAGRRRNAKPGSGSPAR